MAEQLKSEPFKLIKQYEEEIEVFVRQLKRKIIEEQDI